MRDRNEPFEGEVDEVNSPMVISSRMGWREFAELHTDVRASLEPGNAFSRERNDKEDKISHCHSLIS